MTQFLKGIAIVYAIVTLCLIGIVLNQDAARAGKYDQMDQFLYSLAGR